MHASQIRNPRSNQCQARNEMGACHLDYANSGVFHLSWNGQVCQIDLQHLQILQKDDHLDVHQDGHDLRQ